MISEIKILPKNFMSSLEVILKLAVKNSLMIKIFQMMRKTILKEEGGEIQSTREYGEKKTQELGAR